jgi:HD-GYP domain-containing protein (c-di-GMP phosphodiesterase class II)
MTTDRSYRRGLSQDEAAAELRRCSGTQFDPRVVDALIDVLSL